MRVIAGIPDEVHLEWRRTATSVAFAHTLKATAQDSALDLLDVLPAETFSEAEVRAVRLA